MVLRNPERQQAWSPGDLSPCHPLSSGSGFPPSGWPLPRLGRMSGMWLPREMGLVGLPELPLEFRQQRADSCP